MEPNDTIGVSGERPCFEATAAPDAAGRYARLLLVAERADLADAPRGADTLVVTGNWLLWQELRGEGVPCALAGRGIAGWSDPHNLSENYLVAAHDWLYVGGADVTRFHGVSLGMSLLSQVSLVVLDYEIKRLALALLIDRFAPGEICYVNYRLDYDFLDRDDSFHVVRDLAAERGVVLVDRRRPGPEPACGYSFAALYALKSGGKTPAFSAAGLFDALVRTVSRLLLLFDRTRPRVLVVSTPLNSRPLIEGCRGAGIRLMILSRWFPNKRHLGKVLRALIDGVRFAGAGRVRLSASDRRAVSGIVEAIRRAWRMPASGREAAVRRYLERAVLDSSILDERAAEVCWAETVLERCAPDQLFIDSIKNYLPLAFLGAAKRRNIATNLSWHGPIMNPIRLPILGCDARMDGLVDRCLAWGECHERWLHHIGARVEIARMGSLVPYTSGRPSGSAALGRNVLLLQYILPVHDFLAPTAHEYAYYVRVLRILHARGYRNVRFRYHPGLEKFAYYEAIGRHFGVSCLTDGGVPFEQSLGWADLVIGPATSGAMLEVIAAGKPYYPVLLEPHGLDVDYLRGSPIYADFDALDRALAEGRPLDQQRLLASFTGSNEADSAVERAFGIFRAARPDAGPAASASILPATRR